jgi:hypothetical protein
MRREARKGARGRTCLHLARPLCLHLATDFRRQRGAKAGLQEPRNE